MKVKIRRLNPDAKIPKYATSGSAGFDLTAIEDVFIAYGKTAVVKTGIAIEIEPGYEMQIRPRSGTSLKSPIRIANAPGTIDSDYRGEIGIIVENSSPATILAPVFGAVNGVIDGEAIIIKRGDRIAQGVICPVIQVEFEEVESLSDTVRGSGGFGSTGSKI
jgi:dUTP pyrophosphatase